MTDFSHLEIDLVRLFDRVQCGLSEGVSSSEEIERFWFYLSECSLWIEKLSGQKEKVNNVGEEGVDMSILTNYVHKLNSLFGLLELEQKRLNEKNASSPMVIPNTPPKAIAKSALSKNFSTSVLSPRPAPASHAPSKSSSSSSSSVATHAVARTGNFVRRRHERLERVMLLEQSDRGGKKSSNGAHRSRKNSEEAEPLSGTMLLEERLKQEDRKQEDLSDELASLTKLLKNTASEMGSFIDKDTTDLGEVENVQRGNQVKLARENTRLDKQLRSYWQCTCATWLLLFFTLIVFIGTIMFMRVFKKGV